MSHTIPPETTVNCAIGRAFQIERGPTTGADDFFILTEAQALEFEIPRTFLHPFIPAPRRLEPDEVLAGPDGDPLLSPQYFYLSCPLPDSEIAAKHPGLNRYLEIGRKRGIPEAFLPSQRPFWAAPPTIESAQFLCANATGPARAAGKAYRVILNRSRAFGGPLYLHLRPKVWLADLCAIRPSVLLELWRDLAAAPMEAIYGEVDHPDGGWHILDPETLAEIQLPALAKWLAGIA